MGRNPSTATSTAKTSAYGRNDDRDDESGEVTRDEPDRGERCSLARRTPRAGLALRRLGVSGRNASVPLDLENQVLEIARADAGNPRCLSQRSRADRGKLLTRFGRQRVHGCV